MSWLITPQQKVNWTPSLITTALWLDAADASTVTTVSGAVSQWNDKSGNGRNAKQDTSGRRPSYQNNGLNSKPVVTFDGVDDILGIADLTLVRNVPAFSVFCVVISNAPTTSDYRGIFDANITGNAADRCAIYPRLSTLEAAGRRLDGDSYQFLQNGALTTTAFIASIVWDFSNAALRSSFNGATPVLRSGGFQAAGNTSDANSSSIGIGSSPLATDATGQTAQNATSCNCQIAEFIATRSVLPDSVRQQMEGYLAQKWGLASNLPSDHPYKTNIPVP